MSKYVISESGIEICDILKGLLFQAKEREGSQYALSVALGVKESNVGRWLGKVKDRQDKSISWEMWRKIRSYLISHGDIDASDPRWMLPSEMRRALEDGGKVSATYNSGVVGVNVTSSPVIHNNISSALGDTQLVRMIKDFMDSDMCDKCKLKAVSVVRKFADDEGMN